MKPFKIAIITDSHIGLWDGDSVLKDDTYNVFDESLDIAEKNEADIILHAGDLFDEGRPGNSIIIRTAGILRKHLLGPNTSDLEIVRSDSLTSGPNWAENRFKVKIPMFLIHGNHDQPAGGGLRSVDEIFSECGLLNYFKPVDTMAIASNEKIILTPVVLKKGDIQIAIYGLPYISHTNFCHILQSNLLQFDDKYSDLYSILLIHQDRVHRTRADFDPIPFIKDIRNCPKFIVWGHEHEQLIDIKSVGDIKITQPGSMIVTQKTRKDSGRRMMGILMFDGRSDNFQPLELSRARRYIYNDLDLHDVEDVDTAVVDKLEEMLGDETDEPPLVRLVLRNATDELNVPSLENRYGKKVANPRDFILKKPAKNEKGKEESKFKAFTPAIENHDDFQGVISKKIKSDLKIYDFDNLSKAVEDFTRSPNQAMTTLEKQIVGMQEERFNELMGKYKDMDVSLEQFKQDLDVKPEKKDMTLKPVAEEFTENHVSPVRKAETVKIVKAAAAPKRKTQKNSSLTISGALKHKDAQ